MANMTHASSDLQRPVPKSKTIVFAAAESPRSTWLMNPLDEFWRKNVA
jgi:hypothetical protein